MQGQIFPKGFKGNYWIVKFTGTQSNTTTSSYLLARNLWVLQLNFDWFEKKNKTFELTNTFYLQKM